MTTVRERMADAAALLLAREGYQATSFSGVLEVSGAPRGSIYHHFPGGKDELVSAALERQGTRVIAGLNELEGCEPAAIVERFAASWRAALDTSAFAIGCSLVAVTTSAGPGTLREEAGALFDRWIRALAALFETSGVGAETSNAFATHLLATVEGAVAISRAQASFTVFDACVERLRDEAARLVRR